jgi:hypothetical protein
MPAVSWLTGVVNVQKRRYLPAVSVSVLVVF